MRNHIFNVRKENLQNLINTIYSGNVKFFAEKILKIDKPTEVYLYLNGTRNISDKKALEYEELAGLKEGYLDIVKETATNDEVFFFPEYDIKLSAGGGCEVTNEEVIRQIPLLKSEFRMLGISEQGVVVFTVDGESMLNSLVSGEKVLVDTKSTVPIDNRIFAICIDNTVLIKRLFIDPTTSNVLVTSDNDSYKRFDFIANEETKILGLAIHTLGRRLV